jgi:hypothetical protein
MADPTIAGTIITALVGLFTAYTQYKATIATGKEAAKDAKVEQGEKVAEVLETAITVQGTDAERSDLAIFQRDPERYAGIMEMVINDLARRDPALASRLVAIAQAGGQQPQAGVAIQNNAPNYGAQGTFNASVNIGVPPDEKKGS